MTVRPLCRLRKEVVGVMEAIPIPPTMVGSTASARNEFCQPERENPAERSNCCRETKISNRRRVVAR